MSRYIPIPFTEIMKEEWCDPRDYRDFSAADARSVLWKCKKCGGIWRAKIRSRLHGLTCSHCKKLPFSKKMIEEWNDSRDYRNFSAGSGAKVEWKCRKCHNVWVAMIYDRRNGCGCPYCSGKKVCKKTSLTYNYPELAKQWHPTKNNESKPENITCNSNKKVWWICSKNHEWKAPVYRRVRGSGCPCCSGHKACSDNNLEYVFPELLKEWDYNKNGLLLPSMVTPYSSKNVWWICEKGHSSYSAINNRSAGKGCPYCAGQKVCKDNSLGYNNPELAKQWHPTKNGTITPHDVLPFSDKKVWWICDSGHEWEAAIHSRSNGKGCPYCSGRRATQESSLAYRYPEIAKQWDYETNGELTPENTSFASNRKVNWICKNGHRTNAKVNDRVHGKGCPDCNKVMIGNVRCDSLVEALYYLKFKTEDRKFKYHGSYGGELRRRTYDFFFPQTNTYMEVTSYFGGSRYANYLKRIEQKRQYVENVLKAKFEFVQHHMTSEEYAYVRENTTITGR